MRLMTLITALGLTQIVAVSAVAQEGVWAKPDDAVAAKLIDLERQWAEAGCTGKMVEKEALADDFVGTAPDGTLYTKEDVMKEGRPDPKASDCILYQAKVRFYGNALAIAYGTEGEVRHSKKGPPKKRCLTWTDTWLKRGESWKIVAVQDMPVPCPK